MLELYRSLADLALAEFGDVVVNSQMIGGSPADPNKIRLILKDESFLDIWLLKTTTMLTIGNIAAKAERFTVGTTLLITRKYPHFQNIFTMATKAP